MKEQQAYIGPAEFGKVDLSYHLGERPERVVYCEESVQHLLRVESERDAQSPQRDGEVLVPLQNYSHGV